MRQKDKIAKRARKEVCRNACGLVIERRQAEFAELSRQTSFVIRGRPRKVGEKRGRCPGRMEERLKVSNLSYPRTHGNHSSRVCNWAKEGIQVSGLERFGMDKNEEITCNRSWKKIRNRKHMGS